MTEMEAKALHIAAVVEDILVNHLPYPSILRQVEPESKEKIRTALELTGAAEAASVMRRCYTNCLHNETHLAALTMGNDTVLLQDSGLTIQGITLNWNELVEIVQGLIASNRYMTPLELDNYTEMVKISREVLESSFAKMVESSNWENRRDAIIKYGEKACAKLWDDPAPQVRFYVAKETRSDYLRSKMIHDPDPLVRENLAEYGSETIRQTMLSNETDARVLMSICKHSNQMTQAQLIHHLKFDPKKIAPYSPYFTATLKRALLLNDDPHLAVFGVSEATIEQCQSLYDCPKLNADEKFLVYSRMAELEKIETEQGSPSETPLSEMEDVPLPDDSFAPADLPDLSC